MDDLFSVFDGSGTAEPQKNATKDSTIKKDDEKYVFYIFFFYPPCRQYDCAHRINSCERFYENRVIQPLEYQVTSMFYFAVMILLMTFWKESINSKNLKGRQLRNVKSCLRNISESIFWISKFISYSEIFFSLADISIKNCCNGFVSSIILLQPRGLFNSDKHS